MGLDQSPHNGGAVPRLIAIDGPAASGKSTIGQQLAERLGFLYLDTGLMYRAITWAVLDQNLDVQDEATVVQVAQTAVLEIVPPQQVWLDGQEITQLLRSPAVDQHVSQVSKYAAVRHEMVRQQRLIGARGDVVMVGRDIGTVVLPDAPLKLYITASAAERARRRLQDRLAQQLPADFDLILADLERRDALDSGRALSPLKPAADAVLIDTTGMTPTAVLDHIINELLAKS